MARINIEECWWSDPRRSALIRLTGGEMQADWSAMRAWRLAQEYWKHERRLVPRELFDMLPHAPELLQAGLAVEREGLVYVRGSGTYLDWVAAKRTQAQAAGQRSAESRRKRSGTAQPKRRKAAAPEDKPALAPDSVEAEAQAAVPVVLEPAEVEPVSRAAGAGTKEFIAAYCEAFRARYGTNPPVTGKDAGIAKNIVKGVGLIRAKGLVETYLGMNDGFYLLKRHDLATLVTNLNAVTVKHDTGAGMTRTEAKNAEATDYYREQAARVMRGEI